MNFSHITLRPLQGTIKKKLSDLPAKVLAIFDDNSRLWQPFIVFLSALTSWLIWQSYQSTFNSTSVIEIWKAHHFPSTAFQWILHPFAQRSDFFVFLFIASIHAYIAWLFVYVGEKIGIGKKTLFVLFLLLNFTLEYNDVRLYADPMLGFVVCWFSSVAWFLAWHEKSLTIGFIGWSILIWLGNFFSAVASIWALGFPLLFIFWPNNDGSKGFHPRFGEREKFLLTYYFIVAISVLLIREWREYFINTFEIIQTQFEHATMEMSLYMSPDQAVDIDLATAFTVALILVLINFFRVAGILIIWLLWLSLRMRTASVLHSRVRLFFSFCLSFAWVVSAFMLMYQGRLQNDLYYIPVVLVLLLFASNAAYYIVQFIQTLGINSERLLIIGWLLVAYALASMMQFGPSSAFRRDAGLWLNEHHAENIYSNSRSILYYANRSPLYTNPNLLSFEKLNVNTQKMNQNTYYALEIGRHDEKPSTMTNFHIRAEFSNQRGDSAYILQKK